MKRLLLSCLLAGWTGAAGAASFDDPDWPCVQRKVVHLSVGQMWAGPPIAEEQLRAWREDEQVAALARVLAVRRTSEDEAAKLVSVFAANTENRNTRLTLLFAAAFTLIERERGQIIGGISRYARTQTALTQAIEATQNTLTDLKAIENPDFDTQDRIEELEDKLVWDTRIYQDRAQSLTYVCETPVILEKRAFSLARMIMAELE